MVLYPIAEGVEVGLCVDPLFSVTPPEKPPVQFLKSLLHLLVAMCVVSMSWLL